MPVAVQSWNDSIGHHPTTPLKVLNMGPDFVHNKNVIDSKLERTVGNRSMVVMESHFRDDVVLGSRDPRKMRGRGKHKEKSDSRESDLNRLTNKTGRGDGEQKMSDKTKTDERSETDSDSVKLSVRERVQLLNNQSGGESETRGRSRVSRGWMKKRDQSAPPGDNRNRVFQNSVPEKNSPSRRSRSIGRSRDAPPDQNQNVESGFVRGQQCLDSPKAQRMTLSSEDSAFVEVGKPRKFDEGKRHVHEVENTVLSSSNTPVRESHFNPLSRMRDARTVKTFSKSANVNRNCPHSPHIQNVVNSLHQIESGIEVTSESSAEKITSINAKQKPCISVKRMVSLIHKGGCATKPQILRRERPHKEATDSESLSIYSSGQAEVPAARQTPEYLLSSSVISSIDSESFRAEKRTEKSIIGGMGRSDFKALESLKSENKFSVNGIGRSDSKALKVDENLRLQTSLVGIEDTKQFLFEHQLLDRGGLGNKNETQVKPSVLSLQDSQIKGSLEVQSSYLKSEHHKYVEGKPDNVKLSVHGKDLLFSQGQRQVYNLHYKSDSSSSRCKSDDNNRSTTKRNDPEWDEIVAKSYQIDLGVNLQPNSGGTTGKNGGTTGKEKDEKAIKRRCPPKAYKSVSNHSPIEGDIDVFNKSMQPLDFALAIRDITEASTPVRPSDQSFDVADSPRDGVVFARRVQVRDETDGHLAIPSAKRENEKKVEEDLSDVFMPEDRNDILKDKNENTIRGRDSGMKLSSAGISKSPRRRETYSALTTVRLKSDGSGGKPEDVSSSLNVSVEVDVDLEEDYVKINPSYNPPRDSPGPDEKNVYRSEQKPYSMTPTCYKLDLPDIETFALRGQGERKDYQKEQKLSSSSNTKTNIAKLKAKRQIDVQPTSLEMVKPKVSASPEVRRHRLKMGHYRMPSKSSVTSTGSVSYHQSSQGSSSNDAGGQRKSRSRKSSVLSPTLSGRRPSNPPPNDITVMDPHSSTDTANTPRSRSKTKYSRSNSEVSSSSSRSELNRFFDMMGLESSVLSIVLQPVAYDDDSVFQDMHTWKVGSSNHSSHSGSFSEGSRVSADGVMNMKRLTKLPDQSQSIITKNARVIKWLVHCKKSKGVAR